MKFFVLLLAAVSVCTAAVVHTPLRAAEKGCLAPNGGGLSEVVTELLEILPTDEILVVFFNYLISDSEVQAAYLYLQSPKFLEFVLELRRSNQYEIVVKTACEKLYFDLKYYLEIIASFLGIELPSSKLDGAVSVRGSGVTGLLEDLEKLIDLETIVKFVEQKKANDKYVQLALEIVQTPEFAEILNALRNHPEYKFIVAELRNFGVDVDGIVAKILELLGLSF